MERDPQENTLNISPLEKQRVGELCTRCNKTPHLIHDIEGQDVELCPTCDGGSEDYKKTKVTDKPPAIPEDESKTVTEKTLITEEEIQDSATDKQDAIETNKDSQPDPEALGASDEEF